jgi:exodeoxyribonuclease VII large subunit
MAKSRTPQPTLAFMDSLFASLEASGQLKSTRPDDVPALDALDALDENAPASVALTAAQTPSAADAADAEGVSLATPISHERPLTTATGAPAAGQVGAAINGDGEGLTTVRGKTTRKSTLAQGKSRKRNSAGGEVVSVDSAVRGADPESGSPVAPSPSSPAGAITISALSTHILGLFERDELLRDVWVLGEVSNWKRAGSGHIYFSLKDAGATISAVMWRNAALAHGWLPKDGDQILAHGYVSLYPERGNYQLYVNQIRPVGRGQLYAAFEALKERLASEGLFAAERKRPVPARVQRVAVVTSRDGAALRDILRVLSSRWPLLDVLLFPALMQGADCPAQVCAALANANRYSTTVERLDLILLARGGGSIEDLWGFNDETVARAIASSGLPVVTGVGHETDFTIADFVADFRAATPSAAAMASCPDRVDLIASLAAVAERLGSDAQLLLENEQRHLQQRRLRLLRIHPERALAQKRQRLDDRARRLDGQMRRRIERTSDRLDAATLRLDALSPLAVLQRGYSIVQRVSGEVVMGPAMSDEGETLTVRAAQGSYRVVRTEGQPTA